MNAPQNQPPILATFETGESTSEVIQLCSVPPGWYAISVNLVEGRPTAIGRPDGTLYRADLGEYAAFQLLKPVARLGYSIDVYHVSAADAEFLSRRRAWR